MGQKQSLVDLKSIYIQLTPKTKCSHLFTEFIGLSRLNTSVANA